MSAGFRDRVFVAPIHVMPDVEGGVRLLLPDGHSISLNAEAVARSALLLTRAAVRAGKRPRRGRAGRVREVEAEVIQVDFVRHARLS